MIYFDNNATTPIDPKVLEAMLADYDGSARNPSSVTTWGREGRAKIGLARRQISKFLDVDMNSIVFTSGGTEGLYFAILGYYKKRPGHIITTQIEHVALLSAVKSLNAKTTYVEVDQRGTPTIYAIEKALRKDTTMICISSVNNETGCLYPLEEIAALAKEHNIFLIVDGVAMLGKAPITLFEGISAMVFAAHKCHGPKGSGFVYLKDPKGFPPLFSGGHQEQSLRAGTENLPGILGLAEAVNQISDSTYSKITHLRDAFEMEMRSILPEVLVNGKNPRSSNTVNLYFPNVDAEALLIYLDQNEVIVSMGSACSSGSLEPSHVLLGMGYSKERALSSLRFSFSRMNTMEEIDYFFQILSGFHSNRLLTH